MNTLLKIGVFLGLSMLATISLADATPSVPLTNAQADAKTQVLLEQLQGQIDGTILAIAEIEQQAGRASQNFKYTKTSPSKEQANIGLILDVNQPSDGYQVLSVTPGGTADVLGIINGDLIMMINGIKVSDQSGQALAQLQTMSSGDTLELSIISQGVQRVLTTQVTSLQLPSVSFNIGSPLPALAVTDVESCGRISTFFQPPLTRDLHRARVSKIDGKSTLSSREIFKLAAGKHLLYLHEYISDPRVRRPTSIQKSKPIEIEIKPNMAYHLGAKFISKNRFKTHKELFWEPVIWKVSTKKCKL